MPSSAVTLDMPVSMVVLQVGGEIGADGGTNACTAGRYMQAPPAVAAAARARVAAADLVDVEAAIFAKFVGMSEGNESSRPQHAPRCVTRASLSPTSRVNWWQAARLSAAEATDHCLQNSSLFT